MYEDWALVPLDLPAPRHDPFALRRFLQAHCDGCYFSDEVIRFTLFHARKPVIEGRLLCHICDPRFAFNAPGAGYDWDPIFRAAFPDLVAWFDALPFVTLEVVTFLVQTGDVPEHLDLFGRHTSITMYEAVRHLEPMYYRVLFAMPDDSESREASLYVTEEYGGERRFVSIPQGAPAFAIAASTCYHGAVYNRGRFKATAAVSGVLDERRHLELVGRSLAVHAERAVRLEHPGPVEGPGTLAYP